MTVLIPACAAAARLEDDDVVDEAELVAAAFLARYRGRTLDAYLSDLRGFFQWAADAGLEVLKASRPQIESYVRALEARGLAATTLDRRLSTVCGYCRFAHIDGRIPSNPAQYVRRPKIQPSEARGLDRGELGAFLFTAERFDRAHAALAALLLGLNGLRVSEACSADIENLGFERGHRTLRIIGKGDKPAVIPIVPRTALTIDMAIGERTAGPILLRRDGERLDRRTAHRWALDRQAGRAGLGSPAHAARRVHHVRATDGVPLREVQIAARHADPRTTTVYDPPPPELRQARRLRRRRLRSRRLRTPARSTSTGQPVPNLLCSRPRAPSGGTWRTGATSAKHPL